MKPHTEAHLFTASIFVAILTALALLAGIGSNTVEGYSPSLQNRVERLEQRVVAICENMDEYETNERLRFLCRR